MIFRDITITNLFSYHGTQTFDFTGADGRPVVLVLGRNGFGKTSLLNAVKLLFLGTDDKEQRRVGFPPRNLTRKDYAFGIEGGWAGIRNRRAKKDPRSIYAVRAELGDESGVTITATRSWEFADNAFTETLRVREAGADEVAGAAAEERLSKLLPRELVPFFFFDGEELQFLAEASDSARTNAMERLLSLSFISGVERELTELVKEWRREALPTDVQVQIKAEEGRRATLQAEIVAIRQHVDDLQKDIARAWEEAEGTQRRMTALRSSGPIIEPHRLEGDIKAFEASLEKELAELERIDEHVNRGIPVSWEM